MKKKKTNKTKQNKTNKQNNNIQRTTHKQNKSEKGYSYSKRWNSQEHENIKDLGITIYIHEVVPRS